ncbi:hypothetical protein HGI47_05125 [Novosphingobium sp. ERN07]|uniref:hypothetical protein n=1 Tax=Novosphingobium sp. ERN07 TaxID=2726187 RepID=UPI001456C85C|nr:hypothetical protein [Novosphingobium sp. ERN07]NLR70255.1 hypothetical protein [Novosphingobium sp. ERN07]
MAQSTEPTKPGFLTDQGAAPKLFEQRLAAAQHQLWSTDCLAAHPRDFQQKPGFWDFSDIRPDLAYYDL